MGASCLLRPPLRLLSASDGSKWPAPAKMSSSSSSPSSSSTPPVRPARLASCEPDAPSLPVAAAGPVVASPAVSRRRRRFRSLPPAPAVGPNMRESSCVRRSGIAHVAPCTSTPPGSGQSSGARVTVTGGRSGSAANGSVGTSYAVRPGRKAALAELAPSPPLPARASLAAGMRTLAVSVRPSREWKRTSSTALAGPSSASRDSAVQRVSHRRSQGPSRTHAPSLSSSGPDAATGATSAVSPAPAAGAAFVSSASRSCWRTR